VPDDTPLWRDAIQSALYGPGGFFTTGAGPAGHFRTSAHASPLFAAALAGLVQRVDAALDHPEVFDLVDVGAGRGELLTALLAALDPQLAGRCRPVAVELAPRPPDLPDRIAWRAEPPAGITGVLLAVEWLDNVPLDLARAGRYLRVDGSPGGPVTGADTAWLSRWWPVAGPAEVAEIGLPRDRAWSQAHSRVRRGLALAVDYGHRLPDRPPLGTLTGYRAGRQVDPVPDGSCDLTAHVAVDALADATGGVLGTQREALHRLGVTGSRPPLALAGTDPAGYLRALAAAGQAAELTDPAGLGGHWWLRCPVGIPDPLPPATPAAVRAG
jgi:SAM-dependent MidA family methyltransferase